MGLWDEMKREMKKSFLEGMKGEEISDEELDNTTVRGAISNAFKHNIAEALEDDDDDDDDGEAEPGFCEKCGAGLKSGDMFCSKCGMKVSAGAVEENSGESTDNRYPGGESELTGSFQPMNCVLNVLNPADYDDMLFL
jgi:hypothetical protein